MAFEIDNNGNITMIQGDSGQLTITGLNTDKNYTIYFAIQDENRIPIGEEVYVNTDRAEDVTIEITSELTDLLSVKKNEENAVYTYGIKICDKETGFEDTVFIGGNNIGDVNTITVYPKRVEGI